MTGRNRLPSICRWCLVILAAVVWLPAASAQDGVAALPVSESAPLFIVNDPTELVLAPMDQVFAITQRRLTDSQVITDRDVANFFAVLRDHGAPQAGNGASTCRVGMVVSADDPSTEGVLVVRGTFDKQRVLEQLSRRYSEHLNEHVSAARQQELGVGQDVRIRGFRSHRFVMPLRDRVLDVIDLGPIVLFASHPRKKLGLLERTIDVVIGKVARKPWSKLSSRVSYWFVPTADEKVKLVAQLDTAWQNYKSGRLEHRRGVKRFAENLRNVVADQKVAAVKSAVADLERAHFLIDRVRDAPRDVKAMCLRLMFGHDESAQKVKASMVRHLVAEVKKPTNSGLAMALQRPQITCEGRVVSVRVTLATADDQMHAFSVFATYVARGILGTRVSPAVRRLKGIADTACGLGRQLEQRIHVEQGRTGFFSFGRKFSLMYASLQVRADIRRAEDVYVEVTNEPRSMVAAVERLAEISTRQLERFDKLQQTIGVPKSGDITPAIAGDMVWARRVRFALVANARNLVMTANSSAFASVAGPLPAEVARKLQQLAGKAGVHPMAGSPRAATPLAAGTVSSAGAAPGAAAAVAGGITEILDVDSLLAPDAAELANRSVSVPKGMTLEQALAAYREAYDLYAAAIGTGDEMRIREAYEQYLTKFQIFQALRQRAK